MKSRKLQIQIGKQIEEMKMEMEMEMDGGRYEFDSERVIKVIDAVNQFTVEIGNCKCKCFIPI